MSSTASNNGSESPLSVLSSSPSPPSSPSFWAGPTPAIVSAPAEQPETPPTSLPPTSSSPSSSPTTSPPSSSASSSTSNVPLHPTLPERGDDTTATPLDPLLYFTTTAPRSFRLPPTAISRNEKTRMKKAALRGYPSEAELRERRKDEQLAQDKALSADFPDKKRALDEERVGMKKRKKRKVETEVEAKEGAAAQPLRRSTRVRKMSEKGKEAGVKLSGSGESNEEEEGEE